LCSNNEDVFLEVYQKIVAYNVEAKTSIGTALTKRITPVLNYPNDSISIPCIIEVQRLW